jgi:hypothetical protein
MANEKSATKQVKTIVNNNGSGAIYGIGVLGALVYYLQNATSFWEGLIGIFKAIFWPGVILYEVLKILNL